MFGGGGSCTEEIYGNLMSCSELNMSAEDTAMFYALLGLFAGVAFVLGAFK